MDLLELELPNRIKTKEGKELFPKLLSKLKEISKIYNDKLKDIEKKLAVKKLFIKNCRI